MVELLSTGGIGLVLLGEVLRDIDGAKTALSRQNLTTQEGVNSALKLQGKIEGLNCFIDRMFDIAEGEI